MSEIKAFYSEMRNVWEQMQDTLDRQEGEIKSFGEVKAETETMVERMNSRIDELETKMARPAFQTAERDQDQQEAKAAMLDALRKGITNITPEQRKHVQIVSVTDAKALSLGDDTAGGYLAPSEYVHDIVKGIVEFSPIRDHARVRNTNNRSVIIPVRTGTTAAAWVTEVGTRSERQNPSYGRKEIPTAEMYGEVIVSEHDLEDSAYDLEAEIRAEIAEQMGVAEAAAFVTGTGVGQPEGLLTAPGVSIDETATSSTLTADDLITTAYLLKDAYARNAVWIMNRQTIGYIRRMKDNTGGAGLGNYIWQPGLAGDRPNTILDRPYIEAVDMPAIAASAKSVLFGDIKRAYTIVDRVSMVFKRLTEKYAETGQIALLARRRVGAQVVLNEAYRIIKVKA